MRLVRGLYERGLPPSDVRELFRFIDWMMDLPPTLNDKFWNEVDAFEKEKKMPYVMSIERRAEARGELTGMRKALAAALELKFGARGKKLLPRVRRFDAGGAGGAGGAGSRFDGEMRSNGPPRSSTCRPSGVNVAPTDSVASKGCLAASGFFFGFSLRLGAFA